MTPSTERPVAVEASTGPAGADIHSCSYFCDRPECIKAQRDELRAQVAELERDAKRLDWVLPILDGCGNNDAADARTLLIGMWLLRGRSGRELIDSAMKE